MKKFTFLRNLLVAAGLLMGSSAWADDITSVNVKYDYSIVGASTAPFDENAVIKTGTVTALTLQETGGTTNAYFDSNPMQDGRQAYVIKTNEKVSFVFTMYFGWLNNTTTQSVIIYNDEDNPLVGFTYTTNAMNITDVQIGGKTAEGFSPIGGSNGLHNGNGFDSGWSADKPEYVTISISGSGAVTLDVSNPTKGISGNVIGQLGEESLNLAKIAFIHDESRNYNNNRATAIKSIELSSETVAEATVTYKYTDTEGNTLSSLVADKTSTATIGSSISEIIPNSYVADFYSLDAEYKYVYDGYDCNVTEVPADGATIILKFAKKGKCNYIVNAVDENDEFLSVLASNEAYVGDEVTLVWSKYIQVDAQWYVTNETSFSLKVSTEGKKDVKYIKSDIAYFVECENMNGIRQDRLVVEENESYSGNIRFRMSNYNPTIYTEVFEDGGVFDLELVYHNSNASGSDYKIQTRTTAGELTDIADWTCGTGNQIYRLKNIVIPAGCSLAFTYVFTENTNATARMDYITFTPSTETKVMSEVGLATLYSANALNFANTGLTAYIATSYDDTKVILKEVTTIPAKTGVLLAGDAGTYEIPVIVEADEVESEFDGVLEDTPMNNIYVLYDGEDGVGFYKTTATTFTVGANTAYLPVSGGASKLRLVFEGNDATGIEAVEANEASAAIMYNVAGQRVGDSYKGIVIKNGKKYLNK